MMNIPVIDLEEYRAVNQLSRQALVEQLGKSFEEMGFVAIKNHGISETLIRELYEVVQSFFSLPLEKKKLYEIEGLAGQRGYTSFGKEHAKGSQSPDLKEFFQFGQISSGEAADGEVYPPNVVVRELPAMNITFENAYRAFEKAGGLILRAIALYLGLGEFYFEESIREGNSILRAIHYPPITSEPSSAIRAEQHEDINLITLLVGASAEGLQILTRSQQWLPVTAQPGEIVVNVGDMLQRLTNNRLRSTTHRVVNPPRDLWHTSRYSIPFFLHPKSGMSLACLDSCINTEHPKAYPDITAGEYLEERLREIGLRK